MTTIFAVFLAALTGKLVKTSIMTYDFDKGIVRNEYIKVSYDKFSMIKMIFKDIEHGYSVRVI